MSCLALIHETEGAHITQYLEIPNSLDGRLFLSVKGKPLNSYQNY